ncbi:MAG: hypothetical protein WCF23_04045 [Candidatus Nitrosopolaris sp.]
MKAAVCDNRQNNIFSPRIFYSIHVWKGLGLMAHLPPIVYGINLDVPVRAVVLICG